MRYLVRVAVTCLAVASFPACGSSISGAPENSAVSAMSTMHASRRGSWMRPGATSENLLYVSSYLNNDVTVVTYPEGKLVGTLTGFTTPYGLCTDSAGDVWITSSSEILEYAHGGANPIATLSDPGYTMTDCSVDPTTGNLAVSEAPAAIAVYTHASGAPQRYVARKKNISEFADCSYDNKGDLFASGSNGASRGFKPKLAELPAGGKSLVVLKIPATGSLGGMQWDGQYVAVGGYTAIVQYAISGNTATYVGQTPLKGLGNRNDGGESDFWLQGKTVVVVPFALYPKKVFLFNYPAGGKPFKKIVGFQSAGSVAVSLAPSR